MGDLEGPLAPRQAQVEAGELRRKRAQGELQAPAFATSQPSVVKA